MTQGAQKGARGQSIPPSARPSAEHVRALEAAALMEVRLLKKASQRPLMSGWEGEGRDRQKVLLTVVDTCSTPSERDRVLDAATALLPLTGTPGVQRVHRVMREVDAFVTDLLGAGTTADLVVLRWTPQRKLDFMCRLCDGLEALHEAGIVHGCLSPENVALDDDLRPVLTEAGMVSISGSLDGDPENFFGYGAYASDGVRAGRPPDRASDLYSAGRLLAFVMLDRAPCETDEADLKAVSPELVTIMKRCLGSSGRPFGSAAELRAELDRCKQLVGEVVEAKPRGEPVRAPRAGAPAPAAPRPAAPAPAQPAPTAQQRPPPAAAQQASRPASRLPLLGAASLLVALATGAVVLYARPVPDVVERGASARAAVERGDKDLRGKQIHGADLSRLDLSGATLQGADLTGVNLTGSKLVGAKLERTSLILANLSGADLTGVTLEEATGIETASCDGQTLLPGGWRCAESGKISRGASAGPAAAPQRAANPATP